MPKPKTLTVLNEMHEWMREHKPADFANLLAQMSPEERVRIRAHMTVLKDWLTEFRDSLPPER